MRGAMLCLSADLTTHAVSTSPCRVKKWAGTRGWRKSAAKDGKDDDVKVFIVARARSAAGSRGAECAERFRAKRAAR